MKKKIAAICMLLLVILAGVTMINHRKAEVQGADITLNVSSDHAQKGENVTLKVNISSSVKMKKIDAYITYDSNAVEFVSSSNPNVVGTAGTLHIYDTLDQPTDHTTYEIVLETLATGKTEFTVGEVYIEDSNEVMVQKVRSTTDLINVKMNDSVDDNCDLSELLVVPSELSPTFSSKVTNYELNVKSNVNELILSAIPKIETSVVTVDQPEKLVKGENKVTITVTAQSGNTKNYTIKVIKN